MLVLAADFFRAFGGLDLTFAVLLGAAPELGFVLMHAQAPVDFHGFQLDAPDRPFGFLARLPGIVQATGDEQFLAAILLGIGMRLVGLRAHQPRPAAQLGGLRAQLRPVRGRGRGAVLRHGGHCRQRQQAQNCQEVFHACL